MIDSDRLDALGAEGSVDDAGGKVGGTTGNVIARVHGRAGAAPVLLLWAHMDTVVPCESVRLVVEGTALRLGRIDAETTANLGVIEGGLATNIVPRSVLVRGAARRRDLGKLEAQTAHMPGCFGAAARRHARVVRLVAEAVRLNAEIPQEVGGGA